MNWFFWRKNKLKDEKWISVKKRKPEKIEWVLVCNEDFENHPSMAYYNGHVWTWNFKSFTYPVFLDRPITHWKPIDPIDDQLDRSKREDKYKDHRCPAGSKCRDLQPFCT